MTWKNYKLSVEALGISLKCHNGRASNEYMAHYQKWRRNIDPVFRDKALASGRASWKLKKKENMARHLKWLHANPDRRRAYDARYRATSIAFKMKRAIRTRLKSFIRGRWPSFRKVVGCSSLELENFLERKFQPGMSWENYGWGSGKWVIDHINPLASAKRDWDKLLSLSHHSNLQPMWFDDNALKGAKIPA